MHCGLLVNPEDCPPNHARSIFRASAAVPIMHQTIVQHQIMVRKGAQRSDL